MCGVAGYYNLDGEHPPDMNLIVAWALLAERGIDASGAMWRNSDDKTFWTYKATGPAYNHAIKVWRNEMHGPPQVWAAFHARASTKGSATESVNNHPVCYRNIYVMHNGIIGNDDEVFKKLGIKRHAQVDTEAIAACLSVGGIAKVVELCQGSATLAWADTKEPNALHLYTNGRSPLWASMSDGWFSYASAHNFMPEPLCGTEFLIKAGDHVTLRAGDAPLVENVGVGTTVVYSGHSWSPYPIGDYDCYNLKCNVLGKHFHRRPEYGPSTHFAHGGD